MDISKERSEIEETRRNTGFWRSPSFFDNVPNLEAMRASQKIAGWDAVEAESEFFSNFREQNPLRILIAAWIVGAGKSLGIPVIASAVNYHLRRANGPYCERIRRILVLTKEESLRTQLVDALSEQCAGKRVFSSNPSVMAFDKGDVQRLGNDDYDIVVACVQMLWSGKEGAGIPRSDLAAILAPFDMIFLDEPHFAEGQADGIVKAASHALCFGMTGTPIEANGNVLDRFALLSVYGYQTSVKYDGALKFLSNDPADFDELVTVIKPTKSYAELRSIPTIYKGSAPHHDKQVSPEVLVIDEVVREIQRLDQEAQLFEKADPIGRALPVRPHRQDLGHIPDIVYDPHAMIVVRGKKKAESLAAYGNSKFKTNHPQFSEERGYKFVVVHSDELVKLNKDHPWLLAAKDGRIVPGRSARFLIVVNMGREGLDNPACCVVGVARAVDSMIEAVQRLDGRQLRAYTRKEIRNGRTELHVPIYALDAIKIITHDAYRNDDPQSEDVGSSNGSIIRRSFDFIIDMEERFRCIPTISDLMSGDVPVTATRPRVERLTERDKLEILDHIGRISEHDDDPFGPELDMWLDEQFGHDQNRRNEATSFIRNAQDEPDLYQAIYEEEVPIEAIPVVLEEEIEFSPTLEQVRNHIRLNGSDLLKVYIEKLEDPPDPMVFDFALDSYKKHLEAVPNVKYTIDEKLSSIINGLVRDVVSGLGELYDPDLPLTKDGKKNEGPAHKAARHHVRRLFGVPPDKEMTDDSRWGNSRYKALLHKVETASRIGRAIRRTLIKDGHCPMVSLGLEMLSSPSAQSPRNRREEPPTGGGQGGEGGARCRRKSSSKTKDAGQLPLF